VKLSIGEEMNYKFLGKISLCFLEEVRQEVTGKALARDYIDRTTFLSEEVTNRFRNYLFPSNFDSEQFVVNQTKVFITPPGEQNNYIHKDGVNRKCALNIVVSCNPTDVVRWYSDEEIISRGGITELNLPHEGYFSRQVRSITAYEHLPFIEEVTNQEPGNVYLVNTDVFHAYINRGTSWRFIIQNKFSKNPSIEQVYARIQEVGLNGLYI
jgi:hypothetical protein